MKEKEPGITVESPVVEEEEVSESKEQPLTEPEQPHKKKYHKKEEHHTEIVHELEHKKHHQEEASVLKEEITLKLHPKKIIFWTIIIALLILAFFVGRLTVGCDSNTVIDTANPTVVNTATEEQSSFVSKMSDWVTDLFTSSDEVGVINEAEDDNEETETPPGETETESTADSTETISEENSTEAEDNSTTTDSEESAETTTAEEDTEEEDVVTEYNNVQLTINDCQIDWKETWGKVTHLDYTIKNSEDGIIKPSYFLMSMEGYGDYQKTVSLPFTSTKLPAHSTASSIATITGGFSYSPLSTGDLTNVNIIISLYDEADTLMDTFEKEFNLQG